MQSEFSTEQFMLLGIFDRRHFFPASGGTKQTRGIKKTKDREACWLRRQFLPESRK